jgi:amino acid transporter
LVGYSRRRDLLRNGSMTDTPEQLGLAEVVAIGVGGMVGGGIFAVLGLAMDVAGHAVVLAFVFGGVVALMTGYSYAHLGLAFRDDGGSFTYIEHAFRTPFVAGVAGWLLVAGYVGTMALYGTAFGAYGAAMLHPSGPGAFTSDLLASLVLVAFLAINLAGVKLSGRLELILVVIKVSILLLFVGVGLTTVQSDHLVPVFNKSPVAPFAAAALIFVAYEGFELIPNAIEEMKNPTRTLKRGLVIAILAAAALYVLVSFVALGNLTPEDIRRHQEYALAVAARPSLGQFGYVLIGLAALLSTASAINATLFGSSRLAMVMAREHALPRVFSLRERTRPVPWVALVALTAATVAFIIFSNLTVISAFASATFLLIFLSVNASAARLHARIGLNAILPTAGAVLCGVTFVVVLSHTWTTSPRSFLWIAGIYAVAFGGELALTIARGPRRKSGQASSRSA